MFSFSIMTAVFLVLLILVGGLIYTLRVGKMVDVRQSEFDEEINEKIQRHHVLLNPVFLAYIIGFGLLLLYVIFIATSY
jgi:hypothetical protein